VLPVIGEGVNLCGRAAGYILAEYTHVARPGVITCILPATHGFAEQTTVPRSGGDLVQPECVGYGGEQTKG